MIDKEMKSIRGDRRRRFAKACDPCRKRKLRCDGTRPICTRCHDGNTSCHYADVQKPQRRGRSYATGPSNTSPQIGRRSGARTPTDSPASQLDSSASLSVHQTRYGTSPTDDPTVSSTTPPTLATPSVRSDALVGSSEDMRYFGPPSGISLTSIGAIQKSRSSTPTPKQPPSQNDSWSAWIHPCMQSEFERQPEKPLPPWKEAFSLVNEFFEQEHQAIPCFHQPSFMALLGQQYSGKSNQNPAWLASLNIIFAIAQRRRVERGQNPPSKDEMVWGYASTAMGKLLEILMRNTQLLSVQALLCMAWFFLGTPNPQPSFMLTGGALRLAHSIGLHTGYHDASWDPIELEMRKRVFWVAVALDSELCLRTGRPPAHNLDDFPISVPSDSFHSIGSETITTTNGSTLNIFTAQSKIAIIQGHIYRKLYSSQSVTTNTSHTAETVSNITQELDDWVVSISAALDPNQPVLKLEHLGLMRLCYEYYNCVIATNRGLGLKYWTQGGQETPSDLSSTTEDSIQRCLKASRSILALNRMIPRELKSFHWDIIGISSSAIIMLCINVLRKPSAGTAIDDLCTICDSFEMFEVLLEEYPNTYLRPLRMTCEQLYRRAKTVTKSLSREQGLSSHSFYFGNQPSGVPNRPRDSQVETQLVSDIIVADHSPYPTLDQQRRNKDPTPGCSINSDNPCPQLELWATEQPFMYSYLAPWDLDVLLTDSFTNLQ